MRRPPSLRWQLIMIAIELKNRMFSIASVSQAPGRPHHGQAWVAGSAAIRYFEERGFYCFVPTANFELPQTPLEMMRRCLCRQPTSAISSFPPVNEFSSELIEVSELEQLKRNTEEELWSINEVASPESLWFLNQPKKPFPSVFAHPAGRLAARS